MPQPLISIIIPTYNGEKYLANTLNGVISQTYNSWEWLIVNDGSFDGSKDIINDYTRRYESIKSITQKNCGIAIARNNGFEQSNLVSEYVIFFRSWWYIDLYCSRRSSPCINYN